MELKIHQRRFAAARPVRKRSSNAALRVPNAFWDSRCLRAVSCRELNFTRKDAHCCVESS